MIFSRALSCSVGARSCCSFSLWPCMLNVVVVVYVRVVVCLHCTKCALMQVQCMLSVKNCRRMKGMIGALGYEGS